MHNYVIITDSTCDLSPSLVEKMQVEVIPMEFGEFIPVRPRFSAVTFNNPNGCN